MSRCTLRSIITVLLYGGVAVFLFPYLTGHFSNAILFLVAGIGLAVVCGILRCYLTDGDCAGREYVAHSAKPDSTASHPHAPYHP